MHGPRAAATFLLLAALRAGAAAPPPTYDLYLRSDSGAVSIWLNSATGEFRWQDTGRALDLSGRGTFAFPSLGPLILSYSGEAPGYDWVVLALKIYGTRATASLTVFPAGEPVRKVVSTFYDRDTRDDAPPGPRRPRPKGPAPTLGPVETAPPPEVPAPGSQAP